MYNLAKHDGWKGYAWMDWSFHEHPRFGSCRVELLTLSLIFSCIVAMRVSISLIANVHSWFVEAIAFVFLFLVVNTSIGASFQVSFACLHLLLLNFVCFAFLLLSCSVFTTIMVKYGLLSHRLNNYLQGLVIWTMWNNSNLSKIFWQEP